MASAQPAGRPAPHQPARSPGPASTAATCSGWFGSAAFERRPASPDPGRRSTPTAGGVRRVAAGQEHRADLEHRQVAGAAGQVAQHGVQQPGEQRGAHPRPVGVQRVGDEDRGPAGVVGGQVRARPDRRRRNGKESTSVSPAEARSAAISRSRRCAGGQPGAGRAPRQHRRDGVEALQPGDLLDQIGGPGQVGPPGRRARPSASRRRPVRRPCSRPAPAGARSPPGSYGRPVSRSGSPIGSSMSRPRQRVSRDVGPADDGAAAVADQQLGRRLGGHRGDRRVDGPLEPPGRLARQPVPARRPGDHRRIPVAPPRSPQWWCRR